MKIWKMVVFVVIGYFIVKLLVNAMGKKKKKESYLHYSKGEEIR